MDRLENPYRPGAGTPPPALVGRDELIGGFGVTLRRAMAGRPGKSYMPIGLRGVGKTVLLNRFAEIASDEGVQVGFIEAPETGDFPRLLAIRLRKVLLQLSTGPVKRAANKALGVGAGPHRSGDIAAQLGVKVESVAPRRSGLIGKGMIYSPAHRDTAFTVPLFDDFLRRALPLD